MTLIGFSMPKNPYRSCDCPERQILVDPDKEEGAMVAYEAWCPTHGFQTDCWMCCPSIASTEVCRAHCREIREREPIPIEVKVEKDPE